jgi:hypothetical protein
MAKSGKQSATIVLKDIEPMKPSPASQCTNVRVVKGSITVDGKEYRVLVPMIFLDRKPAQSAMRGQPWSEEAQLFSWSNKRPGKATLLDANGELSGMRLHVSLAQYHAELDTRPAPATASAGKTTDDLGELF